MSVFQVLLVAATHGNEINAPWLFDQWEANNDLIDVQDLQVSRVIGNPQALLEGQRYIDRDLNRSFKSDFLDSSDINDVEIVRARELVREYGPEGSNPSQLVIDFHSTTASMGACIVIYGRRPADLAIASLIQQNLEIPIYLHEGDSAQTGFLVESWPCGFVVEIGPVPQGVIHHQIIEKTLLLVENCLLEISNTIKRKACFPNKVEIHRHVQNIDYPRDCFGKPTSYIHKEIQGKDWKNISRNTPIFRNLKGDILRLDNYSNEDELVPVFVNEAAYAEKNIAMSLTKKEVWDFDPNWQESLYKILKTDNFV